MADAAAVLAEARAQDRLPIFTGGSGLYFKALTRGLSAVPPIPPRYARACARGWSAMASRRCMPSLRGAIRLSAERLKPRDRTRIARALEVVEATGRSLTDWHRDGLPPLLPPGQFRALFLAPERDELYARIDARFDAMLAAGALEEVGGLAARKLDPLLPAMKAHGVPALIRHLKGEITLDEAAAIGRADTRHYAKRQFTWFRHQLPEFEWVKPEAARGWLETRVIPGWPQRLDRIAFRIRRERVRSIDSRSRHDGSVAPHAEAAIPLAERRNPVKLSKSRWRLPLTSGLAAITAQPLGSPSRQMRNIITKLLIVVVPRRTAGDG